MPFCNTCGEHHFEYNPSSPFAFENKRHACPPIFECSEGDNDWRECRATAHQYAAEKIAEKWDDYGDGPSERTILVRKQGERKVKKFEVSFEYRLDYSADEVEFDDAGDEEE